LGRFDLRRMGRFDLIRMDEIDLSPDGLPEEILIGRIISQRHPDLPKVIEFVQPVATVIPGIRLEDIVFDKPRYGLAGIR